MKKLIIAVALLVIVSACSRNNDEIDHVGRFNLVSYGYETDVWINGIHQTKTNNCLSRPIVGELKEGENAFRVAARTIPFREGGRKLQLEVDVVEVKDKVPVSQRTLVTYQPTNAPPSEYKGTFQLTKRK